MADVVLARAATRVGRPFYLLMSLVLAAIVTFGFSHTVPHDLDAPGLPILLRIHAAVFVLWVLLFIAQPAFVVRGSIAFHRKLGWFGVGLASAMVLLGGLAIRFALRANTLPFFYPPGLFLIRGAVTLAVFGGLIVAGIVWRRHAECHKRLMLCAAIVIIVPGLERALPVPAMGASWPFIVDGLTDSLAMVGPIVDRITRGRVHPAYYWGIGAMIAGQALVDILVRSPAAAMLLRACS